MMGASTARWRALFFACIFACAARAGIKINLTGNAFMANHKILDVIAPEPEGYDEDDLRSWREDAEYYVADLYRSSGFFEIQVKADLKKKSEDPKDWIADMTITEGPRYLFDSVRVVAAPPKTHAAPGMRAADTAAFPDGPDTAKTGAPAGGTRPGGTHAGPQGSDPAIGGGDDSAGRSAAHARPPASADTLSKDTAAKGSLKPPPGGPPIAPNDLQARPGKPYREDALLKDRRLLLRLYGDAGYVRAQVDDSVDLHPETKTVSVNYLVDPSYPVVFDTLVIRNTRAPPADTAAGITREKLLRSLVPYKRGDTVRISKSDKLIEKLQYTGAFNYVRFKDSLEQDSTHGSILYLDAEEHVPGNAHTSVFYETQYGPGVSVDARHSNLAGTLNEVRGGASLAQARQNLYAGYGSPLTFGFMVRFDDDYDVNWYQDQPQHVGQGPFGGDFRSTNSTRLTFPIAYWLRLVGDAELEIKNLMLGPGIPHERDFNLNFIQTAFLTFVNQQMDPTRGLRFAFTWGNGGPLVNGKTFDLTEGRHNWFEAQTAQYYYLPALPPIKFATRLDGGRFFGVGASNSERFFLGGSRSVRSYDFQSLCLEKTPQGVCVGQEQELAYYLASAELRLEPFAFGFISPHNRWHVLTPIQIVPFVDYGKIWDVRGSFPPDDPAIQYQLTSGDGNAYGLGIRYPLLGIFNLRMDFTWGSGPHFFWLDLAQAF